MINLRIEWHLWTPERIVDELPAFIAEVESNLDTFSEEHREKNRGALDALKSNPLAASHVRDGVRGRELMTIGYALDVLGRRAASTGHPEQGLQLLQGAHELFRGGNPLIRPTSPMRQTVGNALSIILATEIAEAETGTLDAGLIHDHMTALVVSAWGDVAPQVALTINEMLLLAFERARATGENDTAFHERFVRDSIEFVLSMEIPTRLEEIRLKWEEIGEHVAPAAVRMAQRTLRRPEALSTVVPRESWDRIQEAVERGDAAALRLALSPVKDLLETNLRLRLDAKAQYREPMGEMRFKGGTDRFFLEARELVMRRDPRALEKFSTIHFHKSSNTIAKEWYAYCLTLFGEASDIHEIIKLLEDATRSEHFREDFGWTARWNLACALRRLPDRVNESLDVLLPVLENDAHTSEVFELCLLWALEQDKDETLATLLLKSAHYEAHLMAALQDAEMLADKKDRTAFRDHFRRIGRILKEPDRLFPNPKEGLSYRELDQLTRDFIETSLVDAGVEWFRQRVSYGTEAHVFKNWECAAVLNEKAGNLMASWRCRERQWNASERNRRLDKDTKTSILRALLAWAQRNGFEEDALRLLRRGWRSTSLPEADVHLWEQRLTRGTQFAAPPANPPASGPSPAAPLKETTTSARQVAAEPSAADIEETIQRVAAGFASIGSPEALAAKSVDARRLMDATRRKHPGLPASGFQALLEIVDLAVTFARGVDDQAAVTLSERMRSSAAVLREYRAELPYELHGLSQACDRVVNSLSVRAKAVGELTITTPTGLKLFVARPDQGQTIVTRLATRLANGGTEELRNITVAYVTTSAGAQIIGDSVRLDQLKAGEKRVVEGMIELTDTVTDVVDIRIHATYDVSGVNRTAHATGPVPVVTPPPDIPTTLRYVTNGPVESDRTDLFHGRDKELSELAATFAGGRLRRLYFVNGIRRVGKSTLLRHLGRRCGPNVVSVLYFIDTLLEGQKLTAVQFVRMLIRRSLEEVRKQLPGGLPASVAMPAPAAFELDPPWTVFDEFLEQMKRETGATNVLLCFDEMQRLVERIADTADPMDDGFLSWLRGKIQSGSELLIICTGSEPFAQVRKRYNHTIWGNMEPYNVSFVDKPSMIKIATLPVAVDNVVWLPEALDRLWEATEGHPWIIQILSEKVCEQLNSDRRRTATPNDVDRAADRTAVDANISELWWNEHEGLVTTIHRQIAFLILQNQTYAGSGLAESQLAELAQASGIRTVGRHLDEMRLLEVLTEVKEGPEPRWRIRSAFLERHLTALMHRAMQEAGELEVRADVNQPLALMLDWENVKIGLSNLLKELPEARAKELQPRLQSAELASRLLDAAARHGSPRQRWVVADWDRPFFQGDQKAFKGARYWTDIAGDQKSNASDHVLVEKLHFVLREHPEISVFVIGTGDGDFHEAIKTLQEKGKRVILWSTRRSINRAYGESLRGPDRIKIEWLEDLVFGEAILED